MTVSSTTRKAGPFTGNGSQTVFPFAFKVFTKYDLEVVSADASGIETTLVVDSDYTVSLNADQDNSPGGTVTLSAALTTGYLLAIVGDLDYSQGTDLPTGGAFNATNVEDALDRLTMLCQQLRELTTRAVSVGATSSVTGDQLLVEINQAVVDSAASAASALLSLNTFQSQYYGVLSDDPALDPLGNAVGAGDLYFSSSLLRMRAYSGTAWVDVGVATPVTVNVQRFSGTGSQTVFTLTNAPAFQNAAEVFVSGVRQVPGVDYTVTGAALTTLTFTTAPPSGTNNIFVQTATAYAGGVPNDGSVTADKVADGAVTTTKIVDANVTTAKLADANVTTAKIADANVTPAKLSQPLTRGTAVATTSGTAIDFTSIPSWVKRITLMLAGVSTNGTSRYLVQLGSGSVATIGYASVAGSIGATSNNTTSSGLSTTGFVLHGYAPGAAGVYAGHVVLTLVSGNLWVQTGTIAEQTGSIASTTSGGTINLSGTLDRVRLTTVAGTDTFDSLGSINILYE